MMLDELSKVIEAEYGLTARTSVLAARIRKTKLYLDSATQTIYNSAAEYHEKTGTKNQ